MPLAIDILSLPNIPDALPNNRIEALVGDTLSFTPIQTFASPTSTLTRKPSGSSLSTGSGQASSLTFDVPGLFRVTVAAGGFSRMVEVIVFPTSAIGQFVRVGTSTARVPHLRGLAQDPNVTQATVTASLEATTATLLGILAGSSGAPPWSNYGN